MMMKKKKEKGKKIGKEKEAHSTSHLYANPSPPIPKIKKPEKLDLLPNNLGSFTRVQNNRPPAT